MGCNSRAKGATGERELASILRGYDFSTRRGQQYNGADGSADVVGLPGIHIECKRVERLDLYKAMEQAINDAREDEIPAVFHRRNRDYWKVTLRLDDFMKLYKNPADLEDIKAEICDKLCKYPNEWNEDLYGELCESDICKNCPLERL